MTVGSGAREGSQTMVIDGAGVGDLLRVLADLHAITEGTGVLALELGAEGAAVQAAGAAGAVVVAASLNEEGATGYAVGVFTESNQRPAQESYADTVGDARRMYLEVAGDIQREGA